MSYTIADADHVDFSDVADRDAPMLAPVHPGVVLRTEFLEPLAMSHYRLAKSIGVSARRIGEIVAGQRAITADTALRLQAIFDLRAEFWLGLQARYDLAMTKPAMAAVLDRINPWASQKENRPSV